MKEFHKRLKEAMCLRNITQSELCEKTGIPKSAMSQYISGSFRPKQERTYLLAKALNVNEAWLMGYDVDIETHPPVMTIGERIREQRKKVGISVDELAEILGKNRATIYRYESSDIEKLPTTVLEPLARALQTTPAYLMGWDDAEASEIHLSKLSQTEFDVVEPPTSFAKIPVVGEVAAGITSFADMQIIDYIACDTSILNDGYDYCYLKVKGDSMEPKISEDDLVLIRVQETVDSGSYAVVLVDDDNGLVKRVEYDRKHLELISENPYYPPRKFYGEEMNRVRIFGKVVKIERYL